MHIHPTLNALVTLALAMVTLTAHAATASPPAKADPLDARAVVPALRYESSFKAASRTGDDKPISWREANDTVARVGGWRVYAREAHQPDSAPAANSVPALPARAAPAAATPQHSHGGHKLP